MPSPYTSNPYAGLLFPLGRMLEEIERMRRLSRPFIDTSSVEFVIPEWRKSLEGLGRERSGTRMRWEIPVDQPIRTIRSFGGYKPDRGGEFTVTGEMSVVWEIQYVGNVSENGIKCTRCFELVGLGTTRIRIININETSHPPTIAEWEFDIGATDSPGCHFHNHVNGANDDRHFPSELDIPRFPTYLITPMDALDFLLGELFQGEWMEHVTKDGSHWSGIQRRRLKKSLEWHHRVLDETTATWSTLKASKPARHVLLGDPAKLI